MKLPDISMIQDLHHKYAADKAAYLLVYGHCQVVAEIAEWCADQVPDEVVDRQLLRSACLLHDIGSYGLLHKGDVHYMQHALLGAALLLEEGCDQGLADIVRSHVLLGISKREILDHGWALPAADFTPQSIEAEILCYADRFHSKQPVFNSYRTFLVGLQKDLPEQAAKFEAAVSRFGLPDIDSLAKKYDQPIR